MTANRSIRLDRLAEELRVPRVTAWRWHVNGHVGGENRGSGRGKGIRLSRAEAFEFCAIALLRTAGVPWFRVRSIVRQMRAEGVSGAEFFGPRGLPIAAAIGGQAVLCPKPDLGAVAALAGRVIDDVEAEAAA